MHDRQLAEDSIGLNMKYLKAICLLRSLPSEEQSRSLLSGDTKTNGSIGAMAVKKGIFTS